MSCAPKSKAVILIGGQLKATRFRPLALDIPPPLLPIGGAEIIYHHFEACGKVRGLSEVLVIGSFEEALFKRCFDRAMRTFGLNIRYLKETIPLGTGGGLRHFRDEIMAGSPEYVFVLNYNICCAFPLDSMLHRHRERGAACTILACKVAREAAGNFGCLIVERPSGRVLHWAEKPESFVSNIVNCGVYLFTAAPMFDHIVRVGDQKFHQSMGQRGGARGASAAELGDEGKRVTTGDSSKLTASTGNSAKPGAGSRPAKLGSHSTPSANALGKSETGVEGCGSQGIGTESLGWYGSQNYASKGDITEVRSLKDGYLMNQAALRLEQDVLLPLAGTGALAVYETADFWCPIKTPGMALLCSELYMRFFRTQHPSRLSYPGGKRMPTIVGNVMIDGKAEVHPSACLGPNVYVAAGVRIGAGCRVSNAILLEGCTLLPHACVFYAFIGWNSVVGQWTRVEGKEPLAAPPQVGESLLRDVTIFGVSVVAKSEVVIRNCIALPYKEITGSYHNQILL